MNNVKGTLRHRAEVAAAEQYAWEDYLQR